MFVVVVHSLSRVWLCNSMDWSTPGFPVLHHLLEFAQTHVHWVSDAIQSTSKCLEFAKLNPFFPTFFGSYSCSIFLWGDSESGSFARHKFQRYNKVKWPESRKYKRRQNQKKELGDNITFILRMGKLILRKLGYPVSGQKSISGNFFKVQRLRLHTSNAEGVGSIPSQGTRVPHACKVAPTIFFLSLKNLVSGVAWVQLNCVWLQRSFCFHYTILSNYGTIGRCMMPWKNIFFLYEDSWSKE